MDKGKDDHSGINNIPGAWEQALGVIFAWHSAAASASRHHPHPTRHYWDMALRVQKAFWLRLMHSAALLPGWSARPARRQARDLVEAWLILPASRT